MSQTMGLGLLGSGVGTASWISLQLLRCLAQRAAPANGPDGSVPHLAEGPTIVLCPLWPLLSLS